MADAKAPASVVFSSRHPVGSRVCDVSITLSVCEGIRATFIDDHRVKLLKNGNELQQRFHTYRTRASPVSLELASSERCLTSPHACINVPINQVLETELLDAVVLGDEGLVAALLVSLTFVVDRRTVVPSYRRAVCRGDQLVALRSSAKKGRLLETPRPVAISRTNMSYCLLSSTSMANVMLLRKIRRSLPLTYVLSPMSTLGRSSSRFRVTSQHHCYDTLTYVAKRSLCGLVAP